MMVNFSHGPAAVRLAWTTPPPPFSATTYKPLTDLILITSPLNNLPPLRSIIVGASARYLLAVGLSVYE